MHHNTVKDTKQRTSTLSDKQTLDPERILIHKEESPLIRDYPHLINGLRSTDEYDKYLKDTEVTTEEMQELLEDLETIRHKDSQASIHELEEEMKDADF